jgi:hypothetical protein
MGCVTAARAAEEAVSGWRLVRTTFQCFSGNSWLHSANAICTPVLDSDDRARRCECDHSRGAPIHAARQPLTANR